MLTHQGADPNRYAADEVLLSADANILFSSTRYRQEYEPAPLPSNEAGDGRGGNGDRDRDDDDDDRNSDRSKGRSVQSAPSQPGYINAILLTPLAEQENPQERRQVGSGFPLRRLFQLATTSSGGLANTVSPAPWGNDFFALTDSELGVIEVCEFHIIDTVPPSSD
jgi:hypothetical protein